MQWMKELRINQGTSEAMNTPSKDSPPLPERGSICLAPILSARNEFPAGHNWAAEFFEFQASGPTKEDAVFRLRQMMRNVGREAPEHVYDVVETIAGWMN